MDKIYWGTGQFVLGAVSGTTAISIFAVGITLSGMYMSFSTAISSVFLPKVSAMVAKNSSEKEISDLFIRTGRIQYIVMAFILSGFIIFGKDFIRIWAGPEYGDTYIITLMFFVALLFPLIQNMGITVLQARNQMKFRSILYIIIAVVSLGLQIILAKKFEGIGCAIAISGALILGQGLIMNIYYHCKQHIDILKFWKEILKMSVIPIILTGLGIYLLKNIEISTVQSLFLAIIVFSVVYVPLFWFFSMSRDERELISKPFYKIIKRK